jgi:hypothetical protein
LLSLTTLTKGRRRCDGFPFDTVSFLKACSLNVASPHRLVASGFSQLQVALALQYGVVRYREDDTGLASLDRRIRSHIAAAHDIDQPDVWQICGQEVQYLARDGPFATVEVFGRSTLLVTPQ